MNSNKKNSFFSWINSKIHINKEDKNKDKLLISKKDNIKDCENIFNKQKTFLIRLKKGLNKTKKFFGDGIDNIFLSKKIDDALFEELEETMILSDIGIDTTDKIIKKLIDDANRKELKNPEKVYSLLKKNMYSILKKVDIPLKISNQVPFIILIIGINGTGKTTTVSKLAKKYKLEGKSVMLAAADTFRAAGIEQLQKLGKSINIPVISQFFGADPAAVAFDAVKSAISKKIDVLIIDTAGRLHNKLHLLGELKKIVRVIKKINSSFPHEIILVLDACNGQNIIKQTEKFHQEIGVTGLIITKLDGTAKGGVIFSLADQFLIPIRYIGIGEKADDLVVFNTNDFIESIFKK